MNHVRTALPLCAVLLAGVGVYAPAVAQARQELDGFARLALAVELPELTRPAAALRRFLERERE